jgi:hypothetical protein
MGAFQIEALAFEITKHFFDPYTFAVGPQSNP